MIDRIDGIILDYDGVLVDSRDDSWRTTQKVLRYFGKSIPTCDFFLKNIGDVEGFYRSCGCSSDETRQAIEMFGNKKKHDGLVDGMGYVIKRCRGSGFMLAVASSSPSGRIMKNLGDYNLLGYFTHIDGYTPGRNGKPHPDQIRECMERLKIQPSRTCVVDDMREGIDAARDAGVKKIVAATYGFHGADMLDGAHHLISSSGELLPLLGVD